jgi:hypothetical protein
MMLLADSKAARAPQPEQGVIEEARRRQRFRRVRRTSVALAALGTLYVGGIFGDRGQGRSSAPDVRAPRGSVTQSAEATCRSGLASSVAHSREAAARGGGAQITRLPDGGWQKVLADVRGPYSVTLFVGAKGAAEFSCFSGRDRGEASLGGSLAAHPPAPVPVGQIAIVSSGGGRIAPDDGTAEFSRLVGRAGAGVTAVVFRLSDGTHATATISNGWFVAWWPGTKYVTATEVTSSDGTVVKAFGSPPRPSRGQTP